MKSLKPFQIIIYTLLLTIVFMCNVHAQDCGCDHTISPSDGLQVIEASDFNYEPGDTFCLESGIYDALRLSGFKGTIDNPLTFKNCGGLVEIKATTYTAFQFLGSEYVHLTGTGDSNLEYGIHISESKSGTSGVSVASLSTDFEIDHLEISNVGFAGIIAKTDPKCDDPSTWRANYTLKNLFIHDNYIHDTGGEGMYIGSTFGYETTTLDEQCAEGFGHLLENVKIYNNRLENLGWDGLQVSLAHLDLEVYNNTIENYGTRLEGNQNFGLALGGGCRGDVYNNVILQSEEYAIERQRGISMINTISGTKVFNNVITNAGEYGIWTHIRITNAAALDDGYYFFNNTIIKPKGPGMLYNNCIPSGGDCRPEMKNAFYNNLIIDPGVNYENSGFWKTADEAFIDFITKEVRDGATKADNFFSRDMASINFADPSASNYAILEGSPAIDAGRDLSEFGVTFDINNGARPVGAAYDAGAYEFGASNLIPIVRIGEIVDANTGVEISLTSTATDPDGSVASYLWEMVDAEASTYTLTNDDQETASLVVNENGEYTVRLTVTDDEGAKAVAKLKFTVGPPLGIFNRQAESGSNLISNVYPNPTSGEIHLNLTSYQSPVSIEFYDLNGSLLLSIPNSDELRVDQNEILIDISSTIKKQGLYLMMVKQGEKIDTKRISIK